MTPAMAATTAWLRYAGDVRPVELKQIAMEGSAAHPKHDWAESKAGGAMETRFDGHSGHGEATVVGGGVSATVVVKRIKPPVIEHHGIKAKL